MREGSEREETYRKIAFKAATHSDYSKKHFHFDETWLIYMGLIETWDIIG